MIEFKDGDLRDIARFLRGLSAKSSTNVSVGSTKKMTGWKKFNTKFHLK